MQRLHIGYRIMLYIFDVGRRRQSGCYNNVYRVHIAYISISQMKTLKHFLQAHLVQTGSSHPCHFSAYYLIHQTQYMILIHAYDLLWLQLHTVGFLCFTLLQYHLEGS